MVGWCVQGGTALHGVLMMMYVARHGAGAGRGRGTAGVGWGRWALRRVRVARGRAGTQG